MAPGLSGLFLLPGLVREPCECLHLQNADENSDPLASSHGFVAIFQLQLRLLAPLLCIFLVSQL